MADKPLFNLDAEGRWRLAYDPLQWIVQRRKTLPRPSEAGDSAEPRWRAVSFVGSTKRVLARVLGEKGVVLTAEAQARLDALPERFMAFLAEIDSPAPDNARTARSRLPDGPDQPGATEGPSTSVAYARAPKAA